MVVKSNKGVRVTRIINRSTVNTTDISTESWTSHETNKFLTWNTASPLLHPKKTSKISLVAGWTNPSQQKYEKIWIISPRIGVKHKKYLKPPPRYHPPPTLSTLHVLKCTKLPTSSPSPRFRKAVPLGQQRWKWRPRGDGALLRDPSGHCYWIGFHILS